MPTLYPTNLDVFTTINATDPRNAPSLSGRLNDMGDAIETIEGELGINPSGTFATVVARLDGLGITGIATAAPPAIADTGSVGTSSLGARQDHTHPAHAQAAHRNVTNVFTEQQAVRRADATAAYYSAGVTGEAGDRFVAYLDRLEFGPGTVSRDASLRRLAAGVLSIPTLGMLVYRTTAQSIPHATGNNIVFNATAIAKNWANLPPADASSFSPPVAGQYLVFGQVAWPLFTGGSRGVDVMKNGAREGASQIPPVTTGSEVTRGPAMAFVDLVTTDTISLSAYQSSGAAQNTQGGRGETWLAAFLVGV